MIFPLLILFQKVYRINVSDASAHCIYFPCISLCIKHRPVCGSVKIMLSDIADPYCNHKMKKRCVSSEHWRFSGGLPGRWAGFRLFVFGFKTKSNCVDPNTNYKTQERGEEGGDGQHMLSGLSRVSFFPEPHTHFDTHSRKRTTHPNHDDYILLLLRKKALGDSPSCSSKRNIERMQKLRAFCNLSMLSCPDLSRPLMKF